MRSGKASVVGVVFLAVALTAAVPAAADPTDDTTATFDVTAGTLDIVAPATADIGDGTPNTVLDGVLGVVTVTDSRASADASWTASVSSTDFITGAGDAPHLVTLASEIDYWSGAATVTSGTGTFTPGQAAYADRTPLTTTTPGITAFTHVGGTGNNSASWNAALSIRVPQDSVSGTYTGTVTHSVA